MQKLAIQGGKKIRTKPFPAHITIGEEEIARVREVMESGVLSGFIGADHPRFLGGDQVRALEDEWSKYYDVKYAIAVNSATSGLFAALGAIGIGPGDEVIVPPYTMSATVVAPLIYNAIPVFADIDPITLCIDPNQVEKLITKRTKAIIGVDLFGHPIDADALKAIAQKHDLFIIEDAAQAPGAFYKGKACGTLVDIGVYSLNYHKHIHSGEGGIIVTNNKELAQKLRMIRNHAESVISKNASPSELINMIGFNYRMTEIEAAIARVQLTKLKGLLEQRKQIVHKIEKEITSVPCISLLPQQEDVENVHYVLPFIFDEEVAGVSRNTFIEAVKAELEYTELRETEGVKITCGYVKPLYHLPIFKNQTAYGDVKCPFSCPYYGEALDYTRVYAPVCEEMYEKKLVLTELVTPGMTDEDIEDIGKAFRKVWENREALR